MTSGFYSSTLRAHYNCRSLCRLSVLCFLGVARSMLLHSRVLRIRGSLRQLRRPRGNGVDPPRGRLGGAISLMLACRSRSARASLFISRSVLGADSCRPARKALAHTHAHTHARTWILRIVASGACPERAHGLGYFSWLASLNMRKAIHDPRRIVPSRTRARADRTSSALPRGHAGIPIDDDDDRSVLSEQRRGMSARPDRE